MKKLLVWILPLLMTACLPAFADCPPPESIKQFCDPNHPLNCNWQAPWYEGSSYVNQGDTKAITFISAQWNEDQGNLGSTECLYEGDKGGQILMWQNRYGGVKEPSDLNAAWHWMMNNVTKMKVCKFGCHFDYP